MNPVKTYIVEDSPVILENLAAALEALVPLKVVGSAADEDSAVSWLTQSGGGGVDLVIVDVLLKSGTGLGVLQRVADSRLPCRRVVLTNYATPQMRSRCLSLGADRVFDKSNELDDLIDYCARLADGGGSTLPGAPA